MSAVSIDLARKQNKRKQNKEKQTDQPTEQTK